MYSFVSNGEVFVASFYMYDVYMDERIFWQNFNCLAYGYALVCTATVFWSVQAKNNSEKCNQQKVI